MLPHTLILLGLSLGHAAVDGTERRARGPLADSWRRLSSETEARYLAAERAVSNWQWQAATQLAPGPVAALAALVEADRPVVTRCVKLNNYWCIKSARWSGEIGTDDEGHVGFATADQGADAAATLLRRYYLEFGRKSASDIVRRWAPAECSVIAGGAPTVIAVRGIGGTARARYLASRRKIRVTAQAPKAGSAKAPAPTPRVSAVIPRPLPEFRVPDIAAGMGEKPLTISSTLPYRVAPPAPKPKVAATASTAAAPVPLAPRVSCTPDEQRLRNYANRIAAGLEVGPTDDLALFEADGTPTDNLAPVLLAMSSFELGTLRASTDLVAAAVERQRQRAQALLDAEAP